MSNYPMFYENSVPTNIGELEQIGAQFGISITGVDIWERAKCHEKPPHLGNVYLSLLFSQLQSELSERYPELIVDYSINGLDSHFIINGEGINTKKQFDELVSGLNVTI